MSILRAATRALQAKSPVPLVSSRGGGGASGLGSGGATATDMLAKMGSVGTLFAIVNRTSTATAAVDWDLFRVPTDGKHDPGEDREQITVHPALDLWRAPNPFMTTGELMEVCQQHMDLIGECAMVVTKAGKVPLELWPIRPDRLSPVPHPTDYLSGWIYRDPDGGKVPLKPDEVIFMRMPNPSDLYRGMGPVQSILADLDSVKYSAEWNRNFFLNSAEPGGIIEVERRLSDDEFDEMTMRWNEQHRGVQRAHRVAVIEQGKYVPRAFTMRDMQFSELRQASRDVIMEAFGISRATMGITDGVNFAAAKAARTQFAELLTVPRLRRWQEALNFQLLPMYEGPRKPGQRINRTVEFDFVNPVEDDPEQVNAERLSKAQAAQIYIDAGFNPVDVQQKLGLPDMQYGNGEQQDPDRDLLVQLVTGAPTLAPLILPLLGFDLPEQAAAPAPGQVPPPAGAGGQPPAGAPAADKPQSKPAKPADVSRETAHLHAEADPGAPLGVDLSELADAWETSLAAIMGQWEGVRAAWRVDLGKQITKIVKRGKYAELAQLEVDPSDGAARLRVVLAAANDRAYAGIVRDGLAQGVTIPARASAAAALLAAAPPPDEPVPSDDVASTIAALLAAQIALTAAAEAIRLATPGVDPAVLTELVLQHLTERSTSSERAAFGGAITGAQNRGRRDAYASGPVGSLYAVEKLDGNTCPPCAAINGRFICTTDDMGPYDLLYTSMGGYVDCQGGIRCRGVVTGVWRPQTTGGAT